MKDVIINNKKCLFYLHNTFENNHYALASFVQTMGENGVYFSFLAKRFLENRFTDLWKKKDHFLINDVCVGDDFWKTFDLLHVIFDGAPALALCMLAYTYDVPFVLSFHGGYDTNHKIFLPELRRKICFCVGHSQYTTVVCKSDLLALNGIGCPQNKIVLAPPAIDFSILPEINRNINYKITVVARLVPKKGIDTAIRAMAFLPKEYSLDVIGDGEQRQQLMSLADRLGLRERITWYGELPQRETLKIIARNTFFWHPARKTLDGNAEGIPQVLIYAIALGRLCISTYSGHISDLFELIDSGKLVGPDEPMELACTTQSMLCGCKFQDCRSQLNYFGIDFQLKNWRYIYKI